MNAVRAQKHIDERLCGSRHLAIGKPKAQTELSTAAYSRSEARAVPLQMRICKRAITN